MALLSFPVPAAMIVLIFAWFSPSLAQARVLEESSQEDGQSADATESGDYTWRPGNGEPNRGNDLNQLDDRVLVLCPPNNWFNTDKGTCMPCSRCGDEMEMTRPCFKFHDTRCVPLASLPGNLMVSLYSPRTRQQGRPKPSAPEGTAGWRPVALALGVITGVLLTALLVASIAFCIVWRKQRKTPPSLASTGSEATGSVEKKLVCSYTAAPSETV